MGVDIFAQKMLDNINITNANPNMRSAFVQEIAKDVMAVEQGYNARVNDIARDAASIDAQVG